MDVIVPKGTSTESAKTTPKHIIKKYRKKCNPACSSRSLGFWRCHGEPTGDTQQNLASHAVNQPSSTKTAPMSSLLPPTQNYKLFSCL